MAAKTMMDVKREIIYSNTKLKWMLNSSKLCSNISIKVRDHSWKTLAKTASTTGYTTITNTSQNPRARLLFQTRKSTQSIRPYSNSKVLNRFWTISFHPLNLSISKLTNKSVPTFSAMILTSDFVKYPQTLKIQNNLICQIKMTPKFN